MNWDIRIDIYTLTCVKWQALQHRELSLVLCDDLDGRAGRRQWKGGSRARGYIYIQLIHFTVWQKPTQHFKATIFQFKEVTFSARFPSSIYLLVTQLCLTLSTSWTIACQAALFMEFSRQEYWSGYQFHSPRDPPDPGIKLWSPTLQADSLHLNHQGSPITL